MLSWRDSLLQKAEIALTPYEPEQPPVGDTHNVSGNILIATDGKGSTDNKAAFGEYTITVYSDAAKTTVVDTFKSTCDTTVPAERTNTFSFDLPDGTYYATVEYNYALTREIQIVVNGADVTGDIVVLNCDFDEDDMISALDAREVLTHVTDDNYMFMDIDGDGMVSALDARVLLTLVTATYDTFQPLTIQ